MNKLLVIYGSVLISGTAIAEEQKSTVYEPLAQNNLTDRSFENKLNALHFNVAGSTNSENSLLASTEEVGFEAICKQYELDMIANLESNETIFDFDSEIDAEVDNEINLGFNTEDYLPVDFDPYSAPADIHSIDFIEEEEIELDFDIEDYLPEGFSPYTAYFDIHEVEFKEETIELGYDHRSDLVESFDPYIGAVADIHSVDFIEDEEIELGFDTRPYLPEGFDPYKRSN